MSSSVERSSQNPLISLAPRLSTISHPNKCSKLENDEISGLDIGAMPGADAVGEAGFHDLVDNHFLRLFGSALLMSAITAGITYSQDQGHNNNYNGSPPRAGDVLSAGLGQQLGAATSALLEKNLSIPPTLKIRQGYGFNVAVVKDLVFERPYVVPNY